MARGMHIDVDGLVYNVIPQMKNVKKYLESAKDSLSSIEIPSDFTCGGQLRNLSQVIANIGSRINTIGNWIGDQINNFKVAEHNSIGLIDGLGNRSLLSTMEGNTYSFGVNGEISLDSRNDLMKAIRNGTMLAAMGLTTGGWGVVAFAARNAMVQSETGAKIVASVENGLLAFGKGILKFGEALVDTAAVVVSDAISSSPLALALDAGSYLYALAKDDTENWKSFRTTMREKTMAFVAEQHVENAYKDFYENTEYGQWLDKNAHDWFKSDGAGTKFIEGVGYIAPAVVATIATGGAAAPAVLAGVAGAGGAMENYWGEARDSSWDGIQRKYERGEISQEQLNEFTAIRTMSDEEWVKIKKDYVDGKISKEDFEEKKHIRELPEDWTSLENYAKGIGYGAFTGTIDAAAWYTGAKISGFTPFKSAIKNSISRIAIDGGIGTVETAARSLIDVRFTDKSYDEAWEDQGGWSNTILAFGGSAFGEAFDGVKHVVKKVDLSGIKNNDMLKNVGAYISANNPIKSISGIILSPVTLASKFFRGKLYNNIPLKNKALSNGILHFSNAADAILDSGYVRKSGIGASYGKPSSFFFAGVPEPGDIAMNCKLSNKLEAVRIKPTEEVLDNFKYRNINDEALMWDGDFNFKEMGLESEKVYVILENNNGKLQYKEVSKEIYDNYNGMSKVGWLSLLEGMAANEQAFAKNIGGKVVQKFDSLINKISIPNAEFGIIDPTVRDVLNAPTKMKKSQNMGNMSNSNLTKIHSDFKLGDDLLNIKMEDSPKTYELPKMESIDDLDDILEVYGELYDKEVTPEQRKFLREQVNRFNEIKDSDIKRVGLKTDVDGKIILDEGTLLHGTSFDKTKLKSIKEKGIIGAEFHGECEELETLYCADFFRVSETMKMNEYSEFCRGRDKGIYRGEKKYLPVNSRSGGIAFIVNPSKDIDDLLAMDVYRDNIHTEDMKGIVNFEVLDSDRFYGIKDRLAAPLYGVPENAISGIWVGDDVKLDIDKIKFLEEQFPDVYIIDKEGTIIYDPSLRENKVKISDAIAKFEKNSITTNSYSVYNQDQIVDNRYKQTAEKIINLVSQDEHKQTLRGILYEGGFDEFSVNLPEGIRMNRDNPRLEAIRRLEFAYLFAHNPEAMEVIIQGKTTLFHGTKAEALPSILEYGLKSGADANKVGIDITTGEEWSRINGQQRSFISLTNEPGIALGYAGAGNNNDFGVILGMNPERLKELDFVTVSSDMPEVGVMDNIELGYIDTIIVPKEKVDLVKELVGERPIKVVGMDMEDPFYGELSYY